MIVTPCEKIYTIFLKYENVDTLSSIQKFILNEIRNVDVKIFNSESDFINDMDIIYSDLIITDQPKTFIENSFCNNFNVPRLFIVNKNEFKLSNDLYMTYDIIDKNEIDTFEFINRIKLLLNFNRLLKTSNEKAIQMHENLWTLLDYSNFFALILDKNFCVRSINNHLTKTLGYDCQNDLINLNWSKFLKSTDNDIVKYVVQQVLSKNEDYNEFTNDIIDINKNTITVKWFNALINHNYQWIFSIGIPLTIQQPSLDEDIQSIRSYFKEILEQDKTVINAMRQVAKEFTNKLSQGLRKDKNEPVPKFRQTKNTRN